MSITRAAIEKNRITFVALLAIFVAGIQAFYGLPRAEDPGFIMRVAQIITHFPGASPERALGGGAGSPLPVIRSYGCPPKRTAQAGPARGDTRLPAGAP